MRANNAKSHKLMETVHCVRVGLRVFPIGQRARERELTSVIWRENELAVPKRSSGENNASKRRRSGLFGIMKRLSFHHSKQLRQVCRSQRVNEAS